MSKQINNISKFMNKMFRNLMLLSVALLALVGCGKDDADATKSPDRPQTVAFKVKTLEYNYVEIGVVPPVEGLYYAALHPDTEEFLGREPEDVYLDIRYGDDFEQYLASGNQTLIFDDLVGHSHYRIVYFQYDETLKKKVGDVVYSERITTPDAPEEIDIKVDDIKGMSATITVTPPTESMRYFCWVYTMDNYERYQHCSDYELLQYDYSYWVYASQMYGIELEQMIEFDTLVGTNVFSTDDIMLVAEWDTEYLVWAYGVTTKGEVTTNITRRTFKTLAPKSSDMTFDVPNIDMEWCEHTTTEGTIRGWRANATIIPSKSDESYYATITNKDWYDWYFSEYNDGRSDDDYIMNEILYNAQKPSSELSTMYKMGDYKFDCFTEREILLKPDREYAVFVFGMDKNGATTGLNVFPFTTGPKPE